MLPQIRLLLWKNWLIRKKHWKLTAVEVLTPLLLFALSAYGYSANANDFKKINVTSPTYYPIYDESLLHSHLTSQIWYAPYSEANEELMQLVLEELQVSSNDFKSFANESQLVKQYNASGEVKVAVIIFHNEGPRHLKYSLALLDKGLNWQTNKLFCADTNNCLGTSNYIEEGFIGLQMTIDLAFIKLTRGPESVSNVTLSLQKFPYPPHVEGSSLRSLYFQLLPLITVVSFTFIYPTVLYQILDEKSTGAKEYIKMSGIRSSTIWAAWFLQAFFTDIFSICIIVFFLKIPLWGEAPIQHSDGLMLFILLFLYFTASLSFCMFMSTFLDGKSLGMAVGLCLDMLTYFIPAAIMESCTITRATKIFLGFLPNMSLQYGYSIISAYEEKDLGLLWNNWWTYGELDVSMGEIFLTLIGSTAFFILSTLYMDAVNPGQYGLNKPFYFPVKYLIKTYSHTRQLGKGVDRSDANSTFINLEEIPSKTHISIKGLEKKYKQKVVVNNLDLNLHSNSITVLLGQNGAGKSTLMSILAGLIKPSSGSIIENGKNVYENLEEFRQKIGLCTQHNLLFNELTVKEHLQFFAKVKGTLGQMEPAEAERQIEGTLATLGLTEKGNSLAQFLSGGMKRKLCLAIAIIGQPKLLILDEPTSGIDEESRRKIWNTLREIRNKKTILLSTHYMDEADFLADYVAIMDDGELKKFDTPLQLKIFHGESYLLRFSEKVGGSSKSSTRRQLPRNQIIKNIQELEHDNEGVPLNLTVPTAKDVFLQTIARDEVSETEIKDFGKPAPTLYRRTGALLLKRCFFIRRKLYWYLPRFLVTLLLFVAAMFLIQGINKLSSSSEGKLDLTLGTYEDATVYFSTSREPEIQNLETHYKKIVEQNGNVFEVTNVTVEVIKKGTQDLEFYKKHFIFGADLRNYEDQLAVNVMYSKFALHSAPISLNLATNALVKLILGEDYSISCSNMPLDVKQGLTYELPEIAFVAQWLILVPTGMLLLISNFIVFPFTELSTNFTQIQFMTGVSPALYWVVNLFFDLIVFTAKTASLIGIASLIDYAVFNFSNYGPAEYEFIIAILMMYAFSTLPIAYLFGNAESLDKSLASFAVLGLISGLVPTAILIVSEIIKFSDAGKGLLSSLLVVSPQYGLNYWCFKFAKKYVNNFNWDHMELKKKMHLCNVEPHPCCNDNGSTECLNYKNYFNGEYLSILLNVTSGLIYFTILVFWRTGLLLRIRSCKKSDLQLLDFEDENILEVNELTKTFRKTKVVADLNMKLKKNTCYGFLGINGAGKTTTFRLLVQDLFLDTGHIKVRNSNNEWIPISDKKYPQTLAYCPQIDALNLELTGDEHLKIMSLLRGYSFKESKEITEGLLKRFGLDKYKGQPALQYSGGNKRKLCSCLALIGTPTLILMDEPTTGVDPISQEDFWNYMRSIKKKNSVLLSSHNMLEVEKLCDEILMMGKGKIFAAGSATELKYKFAKGYRIVIQLKPSSNNVETLKDEINKIAIIEDEHKIRICCRSNKNVKLSEIFQILIELQESCGCIEDFLVENTTLDDVCFQIAENSIM